MHDNQMQWDLPGFVWAPGGPPSNVAICNVRLGGRAALMGKAGDDDFGNELVLMMNKEKVQTRAVKFDENVNTACSYMKIRFEDGKMKTETVKESAEDSLISSELNLAVLKEPTLFKAIRWSKKLGGLRFLDLNLPLPFWRSRDETRELIKKAWNEQISSRFPGKNYNFF